MYVLPQDTYNKAVECMRAIGEGRDCPYYELFIQDKNVFYKMRACNFDMDYDTKEDTLKEMILSIITMIDTKYSQKLNSNNYAGLSVYYENFNIWEETDTFRIREEVFKDGNTYNYSKVVDDIVKIAGARIHICDNLTDYMEETGAHLDPVIYDIIDKMYDCGADYEELNYLENTMYLKLEDSDYPRFPS